MTPTHARLFPALSIACNSDRTKVVLTRPFARCSVCFQYDMRFELFYVNFTTMERFPKLSSRCFTALIEAGGGAPPLSCMSPARLGEVGNACPAHAAGAMVPASCPAGEEASCAGVFLGW